MAAPNPGPAESEGTDTAASEQADGQEQQQQQTEQTTDADGLSAIRARMDEMAAQQEQLVQMFTPAEDEEDGQEFDPSEFYDEDGDLTDEGARALIGELVAEQVNEQLAPREQARAMQDRDAAFDDLRDEYPGLQDDKIAGQAIGQALEWANTHAPELIDTPAFIDLIEQAYVGMQYRERVDSERSTQNDRQVVLESAQGSRPSDDQQVDWGQRIVDAAARLRPQI